jgi:hypothetical protein
MKLTTHLQLMPRSRKRGSIHPLPHTPSWRNAELVNFRDNFIFYLLGATERCHEQLKAEWAMSELGFEPETPEKKQECQLSSLPTPISDLWGGRQWRGARFQIAALKSGETEYKHEALVVRG